MEFLAEKFSQHFRVVLATTHLQKHHAYAIRHQVYAEELGWEPLSNNRLESDSYDSYAYHCLLEHSQSGVIAGCIRLILPLICGAESRLPCQTLKIPMSDKRRLSEFVGEAVGEISRLAVLSDFRPYATVARQPFMRDSRITFPSISVGLYLSAIALVELCELERVLVVMEPRLHRHLRRYGLVFRRISDIFELRGQRALFELPNHELTINMNEHILKFYRMIHHDLGRQFEEAPLRHFETVQPSGHI